MKSASAGIPIVDQLSEPIGAQFHLFSRNTKPYYRLITLIIPSHFLHKSRLWNHIWAATRSGIFVYYSLHRCLHNTKHHVTFRASNLMLYTLMPRLDVVLSICLMLMMTCATSRLEHCSQAPRSSRPFRYHRPACPQCHHHFTSSTKPQSLTFMCAEL